MAFDARNLSALAYANGFTLWHYRTSDSAAMVDGSGYFNEAARILREGDFILVNCGLGTAPESGVVVVVANSGGIVDVSNLTPFGALNTD